MPFLPPNQQLQSTEGKYLYLYHLILITLISTLNSNTYTNSDLTSLRLAYYVGCQHDTAGICC